MAAHEALSARGVRSRVVSLPSWDLFEGQSQAYRDEVLPPGVTARLAVEQGSPREAALRYERTLQQAYGGTGLDAARPFFDICLLGLGQDGHTASLLPGGSVLQERQRWVAVVPEGRPEIRITMTYPLLQSCRQAAFLVSGAEKAPVFEAIRAGGSRVPAAQLEPVGELTWFVDRAAWAQGGS